MITVKLLGQKELLGSVVMTLAVPVDQRSVALTGVYFGGRRLRMAIGQILRCAEQRFIARIVIGQTWLG